MRVTSATSRTPTATWPTGSSFPTNHAPAGTASLTASWSGVASRVRRGRPSPTSTVASARRGCGASRVTCRMDGRDLALPPRSPWPDDQEGPPGPAGGRERSGAGRAVVDGLLSGGVHLLGSEQNARLDRHRAG